MYANIGQRYESIVMTTTVAAASEAAAAGISNNDNRQPVAFEASIVRDLSASSEMTMANCIISRSERKSAPHRTHIQRTMV